jgi:GDPmannose 4,6-dehydratase
VPKILVVAATSFEIAPILEHFKIDVGEGSGILYNHESPRRDAFYLPRKITSTAAKIKLGIENSLMLGDLEARRDWGFPGDFVEAMWLMLQVDTPRDYVIGTGESHSVRDLLDIVFGYIELDWTKYVNIDDALVRPRGDIEIVADASKIQRDLGWEPKTKLADLLEIMVREDLILFQPSQTLC